MLFIIRICKQGNLPVALIFDYPENTVKQEDINMLSNQFGVYIVPRHKQRQSTLCIVIKGIEKYVGNFFCITYPPFYSMFSLHILIKLVILKYLKNMFK